MVIFALVSWLNAVLGLLLGKSQPYRPGKVVSGCSGKKVIRLHLERLLHVRARDIICPFANVTMNISS